MDPICHTLVGACFAETGLKRRTGLGLATLLLAANLPDIDVVAIPLGRNLAFRRGWTHGLLAIAVLPLLLTALMWLWDRRRPDPARLPVRPRQLLLLAGLGVLTHPFLDYLNNYGMRWLMPFQDRWSYGDSLFIVDPWLWLALGAGVWLSRRRARRTRPNPAGPAQVGLALTATYVLGMIGATVWARGRVRVAVESGARIMVAPVAVNPFRRQVVVDEGDRYQAGTFRLLGSRLELGPAVPKGDSPELVRAVRARAGGPSFLHWARFPVFVGHRAGDSLAVRVYDLRYAGRGGSSWAAFEVTTPAVPPE